MDRINNNFMMSLRNEKTPTKVNQKNNQQGLRNTPRTPISNSANNTKRRNTVSNYLYQSQPQKVPPQQQNRTSLVNVLSRGNEGGGGLFQSDRKSVELKPRNYEEFKKMINLDKQLKNNEDRINHHSPAYINNIIAVNKTIVGSNSQEYLLVNNQQTSLLQLQDASSLEYFQKTTQRQSIGQKLFGNPTAPSNDSGIIPKYEGGGHYFFRNNNRNDYANENPSNLMKQSSSNHSNNHHMQSIKQMNTGEVQNDKKNVINPKWRDMRNQLKQQKARSLDGSLKQSIISNQKSILDQIKKGINQMKENQRKTQQFDCDQLLLQQQSNHTLSNRSSLGSSSSQTSQKKLSLLEGFKPSTHSNHIEHSSIHTKSELENVTLPDVVTSPPLLSQDKQGKQMNSELNNGFFEDQISLNQSQQYKMMRMYSQPETTHTHSKDINSDLFASNNSHVEEDNSIISMKNKGVINSGFSDISPISSQINFLGKSSANKDQSSPLKSEIDSKRNTKAADYLKNQFMSSDISDNFISSLQTPDENKNSTLVQCPLQINNAILNQSIINNSLATNNPTTNSFETSLKTEIESPEIQHKLKAFLEEIGYYKDSSKTSKINKIMAEITLGLVIQKANSPIVVESKKSSHEQIEAHHFDILKKEIEILHSLCKGEDQIESEISKKIVNDVLCAQFGKKCIQNALKNAVKRSRSMRTSKSTTTLLVNSTEMSQNSNVIFEKDEDIDVKSIKNNNSENSSPVPLHPSTKEISSLKSNEESKSIHNSKVQKKTNNTLPPSNVLRKRNLPARTLTSESQVDLSDKYTDDSDKESKCSQISNSNSSKGISSHQVDKKSNKRLKK